MVRYDWLEEETCLEQAFRTVNLILISERIPVYIIDNIQWKHMQIDGKSWPLTLKPFIYQYLYIQKRNCFMERTTKLLLLYFDDTLVSLHFR